MLVRVGSRFESAIRPARLDDTDFLVTLSERVFRRYSPNPAALMLRMIRTATTCIAVAEVMGDRLGFVVVNVRPLNRPYGPWVNPSLAHLDAIAVQPSARRGLGRLLLAHAETTARGRGAVSMSLLTAETNARARRLFTKAGYQLMLVEPDAYVDGQRGLTMRKAL